ncbi:MAG: hypothetical protein H7196_05210, partial [candidate division SR1 bacterium]|nr:hypothetical protein [candidate division SR1 bacterium]
MHKLKQKTIFSRLSSLFSNVRVSYVSLFMVLSLLFSTGLYLSLSRKNTASAASIAYANGQVSIDKKYYQNNNEVSNLSTIAGTELTVRVKYNNTGDQAALNSLITDSIPNSFTYTAGSLKNCYVDSACVSLSDSLVNADSIGTCPSGYTLNNAQCEQRTAKILGSATVCPGGYTDDGQSPPCIRTTTTSSVCPTGWGFNSGSGLCENAYGYSQKCFSGDSPDVSNNCGYQQMPLFDCNTNRAGQSQIFDSTSGYNNPGLKLCSMTPQYFATGSCPGIFNSANAFTYTNIAWLDDWTGSVYNNGDKLDAIMNYQNRIPGGSSNTGQFMSDRFCTVANGTGDSSQNQYFGSGCPNDFRPFLDKGSRTHALTFPSNT